jgi:hypothetical protein
LALFFNFFTTQLLEKNTDQPKNLIEIKALYDKKYCRLDQAIEDEF